MTPFGQVDIKHGEYEYRTQDQYPDPFSLYPGEELKEGQQSLKIVLKNQAIKLEAERDLSDRKAGE